MKLSLKSHDTDIYEQKPHELNLDRAVIKSCGPGTSPRLVAQEKIKKMEPKEIPSCLIARLLVVFTRQCEILVTSLLPAC